MASPRRKTQLTKKKRKWYSIYAPKEYGSTLLGESYVPDSKNLIGKELNVDLSVISKTRNPNIRIVFRTKEVVDNKGICEAIGYYVLSSYVKRFVRKGKSKMDNSYKMKTKDGVDCVIKVFMVARSKVQSSLSKALKAELNKLLESEFRKKTFEQLLNSIISYDFQKMLKGSLGKLYPLHALEIRMFYRK